MLERLRTRYNNTNKRSRLVGINILVTFLLKGWGGLLQFLLVPITLGLMNQYEYGIWLVISNLLLWLDTMDIGLGNGLRNRLAEAIAEKDWVKGKKLISTTFITLLLIVIPIILLLCLVLHNIDCYAFLNVIPEKFPNLEKIMLISVSMVGLTFIFKCIGNVYMALQLNAVCNALVTAGHTLVFLLLLIVPRFNEMSAMGVVLIYTAAPLLVYLIAFPITFNRYRDLKPSMYLFDKTCIRSLFGIGIKFFIAQISGMFVFATSGILIARLFSPNEVSVYQIAYRYFGIVNILFSVISAPLWSATTDAYVLKDTEWIRRTIKKMQMVLLLFFVIIVMMYATSDIVYRLWIGSDIFIPNNISLYMAINILVIIISTCYSNMICGIGKIHLLTIISLVGGVVYIPLAQVFSTYFGLNGVIWTLILINSLSAVVNYMQFYKLANGTAYGIWNK